MNVRRHRAGAGPARERPPGSRLYTYCIPFDEGIAPNPFWGVCTLAICKPQIRRSAQEGDWVVGTGSRASPIGDASGRVVYAMKVTRKLTMAGYDELTRNELRAKIPDWGHADPRRRLGDSVYDFSTNPPRLRRSYHDERHRDRDLGGRYVLLSEHYFYFGDRPPMLPARLMPVVRQNQGHRSRLNDPYVEDFVAWIGSLGLEPAQLAGEPQIDLLAGVRPAHSCARLPASVSCSAVGLPTG